jgi:hypothetical protein
MKNLLAVLKSLSTGRGDALDGTWQTVAELAETTQVFGPTAFARAVEEYQKESQDVPPWKAWSTQERTHALVRLQEETETLANEVPANADRLRRIVPEETTDGPVLWLDFLFLRRLARLGADAGNRDQKARAPDQIAEQVQTLLRESAGRWRDYTMPRQQTILEAMACPHEADALDCLHLWNPLSSNGPRWVHILADALLRLDVVPWLRARWKTAPALLLPVAERLPKLLSGDWKPTEDGGAGPYGERIPVLPLEVATRMTADVSALGTLTAHRFLRWVPAEMFRRMEAEDPEPCKWHMADVGLYDLAEMVKATSNQAPAELRRLLDTLVLFALDWEGPEGFGRSALLYQWNVTHAHRGRSAAFECEWSWLLDPRMVCRLPVGHPDRKIVPVLPLPPMGSLHSRWQAAAARLDSLALLELRRKARDLARDGGVAIPWEDLAFQAGLSPETLPKALDRWTHDGNDGPARWRTVDPDRWTLAESTPEQRRALTVLLDAGRDSMAASEAGQRSVSRRKSRLNRVK